MVQQDVLGLEVAVDEAQEVEVLQGYQDLGRVEPVKSVWGWGGNEMRVSSSCLHHLHQSPNVRDEHPTTPHHTTPRQDKPHHKKTPRPLPKPPQKAAPRT